jgi:hypothetical protein
MNSDKGFAHQCHDELRSSLAAGYVSLADPNIHVGFVAIFSAFLLLNLRAVAQVLG